MQTEEQAEAMKKHFEQQRIEKVFTDASCLIHALGQLEWDDDYFINQEEMGKTIRQAENLFKFGLEHLLKDLIALGKGAKA
jgi:hypothetical protein